MLKQGMDQLIKMYTFNVEVLLDSIAKSKIIPLNKTSKKVAHQC